MVPWDMASFHDLLCQKFLIETKNNINNWSNFDNNFLPTMQILIFMYLKHHFDFGLLRNGSRTCSISPFSSNWLSFRTQCWLQRGLIFLYSRTTRELSNFIVNVTCFDLRLQQKHRPTLNGPSKCLLKKQWRKV